MSGDRFDVAVVGAGAIGASVALALAERGARVVVFDQSVGWGAECSSGNAGLICPSHAGPFATSRDLFNGARWLLRSDSPFGMRPHARLVPFGLKLLWSVRSVHARRVTSELADLATYSLAMHEALAQRLDTGYARRGLLDVYLTEASLAGARRRIPGQAAAGLAPTELTPDEVRALEPGIDGPIAGGVHFPHEAHCDPGRFVAAVGRAAQALGVTTRFGEGVTAIDRGSAAALVRTTRSAVAADAVVIAAGAWSGQVAGRAHRRLSVTPGAGCSVDVHAPDRPVVSRPLMLQELRVAVTPLDGHVRLAGTMVFDGMAPRIGAPRVAAMTDGAGRIMSGLQDQPQSPPWVGMRPCTSDGLPRIGWLSHAPAIVAATGHAMLGITLAPITGERVADLLDGADSSGTVGDNASSSRAGRLTRGTRTPPARVAPPAR